MGGLPGFAVRRPVTAAMLFVAICVLGAIAQARIPMQMMPSGFDFPVLWLWVPYRDGTPIETEQALVRPIEEQLATIAGIKELESNANENAATFDIQFHQSVDLDEAYNAVVDRMERVLADLPDDVEDYGLFRFNPDDEPITWIGVAVPPDHPDPEALGQQIQKRLERVSGVGKVEVYGLPSRRLAIDFDRDAVITHGVDLGALIGRLSGDNFQMSSGRLVDRGEVRFVRSLARWGDLEELRAYPVQEGVVLADVAEVEVQDLSSAAINRVNGKQGAFLAVFKESAANTVEVAREVRAAVDELEADKRLGSLEFEAFFDQGELVEDSIANLVNTALQGGFFAVVILFLFLRELRMTLLIALCIPFSLLLTVTALYFTGGSLNLLSLLGLMIAVGMVVDNAIVVVETIYKRRQAGMAAREAAVAGAGEVSLAITLSTATTMVVFLPLILMSEDASFSFFMGALGFPVVFALAASLVAALVFTPLGTVFIDARTLHEDPPWIRWLADRQTRWLRAILRNRMDTAMGILGVLLLTVAIPMQGVSCTDGGEGNLNDFMVSYRVPATFTYEERLEVVKRLESLVEERAEAWGVTGYRSHQNATSRGGFVNVRLDPDHEGMDREEVLEEVGRLLRRDEQPGVQVWTGWGGGAAGASQSSTLFLVLEGEDSERLVELSGEVLRRVRSVPGVLSADSTLSSDGTDEVRLTLDRSALARYGLSGASVGRTLSFAMRGTPLPSYTDPHTGSDMDVFARFRLEDRQDLPTLLDFPLFSPTASQLVPIRAVASPEMARGYSSISRIDRKTSLRLKVELQPEVTVEQAYEAIGIALGTMEFPQGYGWSSGSWDDEQLENDRARNLALILSLAFVFLLMGVLLESALLPLAILQTVPMAMVGVYWCLYLTSTPFDLMGGVGMVILIGVVVNNGIVLLDRVTQLRREGVERDEALVRAGAERLRPILMTALTTIVGLLPMAMGSDAFLGIPYAPLGRVVAGGMAAATVLTLFLLPYVYALLDDYRGFQSRLWAWALPRTG